MFADLTRSLSQTESETVIERIQETAVCSLKEARDVLVTNMNSIGTSILSTGSPALILGVYELVKAYDYARMSRVDVWQLAVEWKHLCARGLTLSDVRWLQTMNLVELGEEITAVGCAQRVFRPILPQRLPARTCLALTKTGIKACRPLLPALTAVAIPLIYLSEMPHLPTGSVSEGALSELSSAGRRQQWSSHLMPLGSNLDCEQACSTRPGVAKFPSAQNGVLVDPRVPSPSHQPPNAPPQAAAPSWDPNLRELRIGTKLVKRFRVPAANQEIILSAFQEEGWPKSIDDPLPPHRDSSPIHRLQAAIKRLNRNQIVELLRFHGTGSGHTVSWEPL